MKNPVPVLLNIIAVLLTTLAFNANAGAVQLGQMTPLSRLNENLTARVELYGLDTGAAPAPQFSIKPAITLARGSNARRLIEALEINLVRETGYAPFLKITSRVPITEPALEFRIRAAERSGTSIKNYTLALLPQAYRNERQRSANRGRAAPTAPAVASAAQTYGPVRSGQTLWRILRELGLTGGDTATLIKHIVAQNPHAFANADADRLRVGVMLDIPAAAATGTTAAADTTAPAPRPTQTQPAAVTPQPTTAPKASAGVTNAPAFDDAETRARLAALAVKFAAIKARYAGQQQAGADAAEQAGSTGATRTQTPVETATTPATGKVTTPQVEVKDAAAPAAPATPTPTVQREAPAAEGMSILSMTIIGAIGLLLLALLLRGVMLLVSRWQDHHATKAVRAGDRALVAEIARKAEQRLKLEDEVKRRISAKRNGEPETAAGVATAAPTVEEAPNNIERSVERAADDSIASIEEIENRIAHGQYAEAEAMLNRVIAETPNNARAKLRLVEIYYLNERADEFVELASEISALHRDDIGDDGWQRVMRMGKVIAPERPPFSGPVGVSSEA